MNTPDSPATTLIISLGLVILALLCMASLPAALVQGQDKSEREQAFALYEANNFVAALPLLEKVASR